MNHYADYCAAIQLLTDGPGTAARERDELAAKKQAELETALRRDRELQARWADSDRACRDLGIRIRKLADFVGAARPEVKPPSQPWELARAESEIANITRDVQQLESAMDWISRARRQVSA